ncbi:MAG: apolipoprotein N-acyltransferase [Ilumatobacteraceae bacterium]
MTIPGWARGVLAVASGVVLALAFPPVGASVLAPIAVAMLALATSRVRAGWGAVVGLVQGAICFGVMLRWLSLVGTDAWILLVALCAGWMALLGWGSALVTRLRWWPLWIACLWVAQEALRDRLPIGGFPWGRLAFAQTATTLTPWASIGGAPLVTFATALAGALLAFVVVVAVARGREWRRWAVAGLGGLVVLGLSGLLIPRPVDGQTEGGASQAVAAVIQGGVPNTGISESDDRQEVLQRHLGQTVALAEEVDAGVAARPDLVVWPENAVDIDPYRDAAVASSITTAARAIDAPILVGAIVEAPGDPTRIANVGIVWSPDTGPGEFYVKRHPVPFGEYVPFRPLIAPLVGRLDRLSRDMTAGQFPGVLEVGPARVGDVICFEVAYDDIVRDAVVDGGRVVVVQTNNATFAGLGQPEQQVAMSRLRAVEHGRAVLVAATSGISVVINPDGSVISEMPEGDAGSLLETIPLRDSLTISDRLGAWPEWVLTAIAVLAVGFALTRHRGSAARRREAI